MLSEISIIFNSFLEGTPRAISASLAIIFGLFFLIWSANKFISGSANCAKIIGIPSLLIGILIVGFGTSAPEMLVSSVAALEGQPNLALGNAYGSNIANIALILGLTAVIKPISSNKTLIVRDLPILFFAMAFCAYQLYDGKITKLEAWMMIGLFAVLVTVIIISDLKNQPENFTENQDEIPNIGLAASIFWLILGLIFLVISSKVLVWGSIEVARMLNVSDLIIGLTIVAVGTSLPELASSIAATKQNEQDIAIGNIIGSNLFNLLCVVGIAGAIKPITVDKDLFVRDYTVMVFIHILLFVFVLGRANISRLKGLLFFLSYLVYSGYLVYISIPSAAS